MPHNTQLAAAARRIGLPYVVSVHGMLDDWCMTQRGLRKRVYMTLFERKTLESAAAVHCTAQAELEQARKWFSRGRGVVIPLVVDLEPFRELPGPELAREHIPELGGGRPVALYLSRLHPKKGLEKLLLGMGLHRPPHPDYIDYVTVIAGSGDDAYRAMLAKNVGKLDLEDRVVFPGFVTGDEKVSLYQAADVFVLPTSQENFGFVLFEALAAG